MNPFRFGEFVILTQTSGKGQNKQGGKMERRGDAATICLIPMHCQASLVSLSLKRVLIWCMSQKGCFTKAYNSSQISGLFFFLAGNILDVSTNTNKLLVWLLQCFGRWHTACSFSAKSHGSTLQGCTRMTAKPKLHAN